MLEARGLVAARILDQWRLYLARGIQDMGRAGEGYSTKRGNFAADSLQVQQSMFTDET
jgi:hypothetical protein